MRCPSLSLASRSLDFCGSCWWGCSAGKTAGCCLFRCWRAHWDWLSVCWHSPPFRCPSCWGSGQLMDVHSSLDGAFPSCGPQGISAGKSGYAGEWRCAPARRWLSGFGVLILHEVRAAITPWWRKSSAGRMRCPRTRSWPLWIRTEDSLRPGGEFFCSGSHRRRG